MSNVTEVDEINSIDEVLEALRKVKEYCESRLCKDCKLKNSEGRCGVVYDTPHMWNIKPRTHYM